MLEQRPACETTGENVPGGKRREGKKLLGGKKSLENQGSKYPTKELRLLDLEKKCFFGCLGHSSCFVPSSNHSRGIMPCSPTERLEQ